jgi:cytochrome c553
MLLDPFEEELDLPAAAVPRSLVRAETSEDDTLVADQTSLAIDRMRVAASARCRALPAALPVISCANCYDMQQGYRTGVGTALMKPVVANLNADDLVAIAAYLVSRGPAAAPAISDVSALVAQGKARFDAYKCYDCHGANGEGTDDGPSFVKTHLTADEISKFLQKPSADVPAKEMPDIPATSPDLQPLVAYVVSLKRAAP